MRAKHLPAPVLYSRGIGALITGRIERPANEKILRAVYFDADGKIVFIAEAADVWTMRDILTAYEPAYNRAPARAHKEC